MAWKACASFIRLLPILIAIVAFVPYSVSSSGGTAFVFAPMPNHPNVIAESIIGVILQATTDEPTTVHITVPGRSFERQHTISPNPLTLSLPRDLIHQTTSGPIDSTVHVTSDKAITVVHYNLDPSNSDLFTVIPSESLGQEYFVATMTWESNPTEGSGVVTLSALAEIVSVEIHVTSAVQFVDETFQSGDVFRYTLRPFQTVQLLPQFTAITGTRIITNTSIAVSAGSKCANVPAGVQYCDHIAEQLSPFKSWGKKFLVSPLFDRGSGYVFQIVAGRDQTTVLYDNIILRLNMGEFRTVDIPSQTMTFVSSDKPITIMQYAKGRTSDKTTKSDPSMIRVPPIEQYVREAMVPVYEFSRESTYIDSIHLELTAECAQIENISIFKDLQPVSVTWIAHYSMTVLNGTMLCSQWTEVSGGSYRLRSEEMTTVEGHTFFPRFRAVVYGTGFGESYLYRAGASERPLTCSDGPLGTALTGEHDCPILFNPEMVFLKATNLTITWDTSPDNFGLFEACAVYITSGEGISMVVTIATHPPVVLSQLHPYTKYTFYVNCTNSLGIKARLDFPAQTTLKAEPHPPTDVTITEVTQSSAVASWKPPLVTNGNGTVDGYLVFAELQECLSSSCLTELKIYHTRAVREHLELDPLAKYRVIVIAYNNDSRILPPEDILNSSNVTSGEFTTLKAEPGPPNNVTISEVTESSALVSWTQPVFHRGPIDGYTVYAIPENCISVSCETVKTNVDADVLTHKLVLRPYLSYKAVVLAFAYEPRISVHTKLNSLLAYSESFTTLQTVPMKPTRPVINGGVTDYSFDINVPNYHNPNGPISCLAVIVVQLYDETMSIDSDDNAYSINNTRDFNIAKTRIGTPFSVMVFSSIPADNVITVGSRHEVHSECNTLGEAASEDSRKRHATVRGTTLHATNGPLNPDSFYSCFIRVYSPSHQNGEVYFANGPFIKPIRLKVPVSGTVTAVVICTVVVVLLVICVIVVLICKRYRQRRAHNPTSASAAFTFRRCTDALPTSPRGTRGNQHFDHDYTTGTTAPDYTLLDKKPDPVQPSIYQNINDDVVEGEYEFMIYKGGPKGSP
ncbi:uncharacterized protein LOC129271866 [Lytechinus pictus]|uniref:uncharacterized protein LOC129271866 n=1 Tax=Lytechinus pictus TaxID=7653 RepID=UPI0030B9F543